MSLAAAERFFALLAIVALAGAVGVVAALLVPVLRGPLGHLHAAALWLAWLVAATATVGSLYFSEAQGFEPCKLCWFQRVAMYSLAVVLLVGAIRRDHAVRWYAVPLAAIGLVIAIYHRLIEWRPEWEGSGTCSALVPCNTPYFTVFEVFTLSAMAACGFAAILALLLLVPAPDPDSVPIFGDEMSYDDVSVPEVRV